MKEIILDNGFFKLGILPDCGGSLSFLKVLKDGVWIDVLRPMERPIAGKADANNASMFVMLPYCGRIKGGTFTYWGITRKVPKNHGNLTDPIHGDAWKSRFEVVRQNPREVVLKLCHGKDGGGYPFSYDAEVSYSQDGHRLMIGLKLKNTSSLPMPCGMGIHPFFVKTKDVELDFKTQTVWSNWSDPIHDQPYVTPEAWNFSGGRPLKNGVFDTCFGGFDSPAKVVYPEWGVCVEMASGNSFKHVVLYAPKGKDFFCLEPTTNASNAFNLAASGMIGTGILSIGPGQEISEKITLDIQG